MKRKRERDKLELYNLENDPGEKHDVAADNPEIVEQIETIIATERAMPVLERFRFGNYAGNGAGNTTPAAP